MQLRDLPSGPVRGSALAVLSIAGILALSSCAGGGAGGGSGDPEYVEGGTFVYGIGTDLGTLDPHVAITSAGLAAARFAYDQLVSIDAEGTLASGLASEWEVSGTTVTLTLRDDVTCADGSPFTATTAKGNLDFIGDPANASPLLGVFVPVGATTVADDAAGTLTLTLAAPSPFVLEGLANVPMVCDAGLADRDLLTDGTVGSGPFVLTEAVPNDHYSYEVREGYAWGPDDATTDVPGMPAAVELRVVANETTATNLLLSGEVDAAQVLGPDAARLADMHSVSSTSITGEQWFNQAAGQVTSDVAVRTALTQALDLDELANVLTSGTGERATQLATVAPAACVGGDFTSAIPEFDVEAAAATLDEAGWELGSDGVRTLDGTPLTITFVHDSALGPGGAAAAELAVAAWTELGVQVDASTSPTDEVAGLIFGGGSWDVVWEPLNVNTPDQLVGLISGPSPADGGQNFASIENAAYDEAVAEAFALTGTDSCDAWFAAEEALVADVDVVPFANAVLSTYGSGAVFEMAGTIVPTSIRLVD